jgi:chaperone BCS1
MFNGCIIAMTTNHIDRLPESLIRDGRIDRKWYIGYVADQQIREACHSFYSEYSNDKITKLADSIIGLKMDLTIAKIQNYFILHDEIDSAITNVADIAKNK